jgi:hypothetical protein
MRRLGAPLATAHLYIISDDKALFITKIDVGFGDTFFPGWF